MKAGVLHEGKDLGRKANWIVCAGCCIPGIVSGANYCLVPYTCCASESRSCFVCASECSFPCSDDVPLMLTLLCPGLVVYPKCGCCMKVEDVMGPPARAADDVELDRMGFLGCGHGYCYACLYRHTRVAVLDRVCSPPNRT